MQAEEESNAVVETERVEAGDPQSLRDRGKELHDAGSYSEAALLFGQAADQLQSNDDQVTCRLHQALCWLKANEYEQARDVCTQCLHDATAPAWRARALHRRAKAEWELGNTEQALEDARAAAFLGDRKAVALYGKLMRESRGSSGSIGSLSDTSLFESLLTKSTTEASTMTSEAFNPMGMLGAGDATSGLAKSVLSSLSKRLDDPQTIETLSTFLQSASGPQIQQYAGMAGMQLPEAQAAQLASFCQGMTKQRLQSTVTLGRRAWYVVRLIQKTMKLVSKYRSLLILLCLMVWVKSAVLRPLPLSKRAVRQAAAEALQQAPKSILL